MKNNKNNKPIPATPGQKKIMSTIQDELFPEMDKLKDLMIEVHECRISYHAYSSKLQKLEKEYSKTSKRFFSVVKKLQTPDDLFEGVDGGMKNMADYFQFKGAFQKNIEQGMNYIEIIDRSLDRKLGAIYSNRAFYLSLLAILISVIFAGS